MSQSEYDLWRANILSFLYYMHTYAATWQMYLKKLLNDVSRLKIRILALRYIYIKSLARL